MKDMDEHVTATILDDAPPVLSLGKLCIEHGWSYVWDPGSRWPILKKGTRALKCHVVHNVPNIQISKVADADVCPATDEAEGTQPHAPPIVDTSSPTVKKVTKKTAEETLEAGPIPSPPKPAEENLQRAKKKEASFKESGG